MAGEARRHGISRRPSQPNVEAYFWWLERQLPLAALADRHEPHRDVDRQHRRVGVGVPRVYDVELRLVRPRVLEVSDLEQHAETVSSVLRQHDGLPLVTEAG